MPLKSLQVNVLNKWCYFAASVLRTGALAPVHVKSCVWAPLVSHGERILKIAWEAATREAGPIKFQGSPDLSNTLFPQMCHSWLNINRSSILTATCSHITQGLGEVTIKPVNCVTDPRGWLFLLVKEGHIKQDLFKGLLWSKRW